MGMLASMTGFARTEGSEPEWHWVWELKSVNGRALDLRFRLPPGFDMLEADLKQRAGSALRRGNISATLSITESQRATTLRVNEAALEQVLGWIERYGARAVEPPRLDGLLGLPGVLEVDRTVPDEDERQRRATTVTDGFNAAVSALAAARQSEGGRIATVLRERLDQTGRLIEAAAASASLQPDAIRARFHAQLERLMQGNTPVSEDRVAQELAMLVQRADVLEELDRLKAHIVAARALLDEGTGVGRKLDFLCQEFNREANTICSKSADLGLTRVGLDLKAVIEQFREQVQNVE